MQVFQIIIIVCLVGMRGAWVAIVPGLQHRLGWAVEPMVEIQRLPCRKLQDLRRLAGSNTDMKLIIKRDQNW